MDLLVDIPMPLGDFMPVEKLEIHQFKQSMKQSIKFEPGWVITVQDACGHSLNIQLNESTQHSGSHLERLIEFLSLYILC